MFTLLTKKQLTHDVYELRFESDVTFEIRAGQFFMFLLPSGLRRAYSIAYSDGDIHTFIIKRLEDGKGGSKEICDLECGLMIEIMKPMGHFILREDNNSKLFIGTGTGFAPLYFQIRRALEFGNTEKIYFVFGVRAVIDIFYLEELESLKKNYVNFDFSIYLSREKNETFRHGYVTDYLDPGGISSFDEFYICGSGSLVRDAKEKLIQQGISKEKIFFEQY